jgi:hypothetical protein
VVSQRQTRLALCCVAILASGYYLFGEFSDNLYLELYILHIGWILVLGVLWIRVWKSKQSPIGIGFLATFALAISILVWGYRESDRVSDRLRQEVRSLAHERLGVYPELFGSSEDPLHEICWDTRSGKPEAINHLRLLARDRKPGWCRAVIALARSQGEEIPRVINWAADQPLTLCRVCTHIWRCPTVGSYKSQVRLELELIASAEGLRESTLKAK